MTAPRPICGHCGRLYGHRRVETKKLQCRIGEEPPTYAGNGVEVARQFWTSVQSRASLAAVLTPHPHNDTFIARSPEEGYDVWHQTIWDGETWVGGYTPFCTLRCALDYARKAYAKVTAKEKA